jgi:hypothetical protein
VWGSLLRSITLGAETSMAPALVTTCRVLAWPLRTTRAWPLVGAARDEQPRDHVEIAVDGPHPPALRPADRVRQRVVRPVHQARHVDIHPDALGRGVPAVSLRRRPVDLLEDRKVDFRPECALDSHEIRAVSIGSQLNPVSEPPGKVSHERIPGNRVSASDPAAGDAAVPPAGGRRAWRDGGSGLPGHGDRGYRALQVLGGRFRGWRDAP